MSLDMKRGEVWWASLPSATGSGPGYRRPVVVVQANSFNLSKISTVLVAAITSNLSLANAPGNVRISKSDSGLSKPSVINISQVITVDKSILTERVKMLPGKVLARVDEGLKLVLCL
jgi:mRNA interferase MazF